jgi:hypothetical protein
MISGLSANDRYLATLSVPIVWRAAGFGATFSLTLAPAKTR